MSAPPPYTVDAGADPSKYPPAQPQGGYPAQPQAGYPPQPAYPSQPYQQYPLQPVAAQPAGGQSTIVVNVPTVQLGNTAGQVPVHTMCPNCHNSVVTNLTYEIGGLTWLIFAILCFVGFWLCACIPFCVDDCKDIVHTCPSCGFVLGRHRRL